jgi:hypothetical protein
MRRHIPSKISIEIYCCSFFNIAVEFSREYIRLPNSIINAFQALVSITIKLQTNSLRDIMVFGRTIDVIIPKVESILNNKHQSQKCLVV